MSYDMVVELLGEARLMVHRSIVAVEQLHVGTGITVPMRAVLEFLHREGATTVADIARSRSVSRQHIQVVVNDLADRDLVVRCDNPNHKRSPLIDLTDAGRRAIDSMFEAERKVFAAEFDRLGAAEVEGARRVLAAISEAMSAYAHHDRPLQHEQESS